ETQILDFGNITRPQEIQVSKYTLLVAPTADPRTWSRRLSLDWSDAQTGTVFVGPSPVAGLSGPAVIVLFPASMKSVDPVLVGTSTTFTATDFSIQRKTFEYGGRYWAFWDDGSNVVYASSQFGYAQGQNTLTWTAKMSTGSGTVGKGFDVSQAGGTVLLGYVNSGLTTMSVLIGTISGTVITWYGPYLIDDWGSAQYPEAPIVGAGVPTVAIGT